MAGRYRTSDSADRYVSIPDRVDGAVAAGLCEGGHAQPAGVEEVVEVALLPRPAAGVSNLVTDVSLASFGNASCVSDIAW